jgi:hypothetical protein
MDSLVTDSNGTIWDLSSAHILAAQPGSVSVSILVLSSGSTVNIFAPFATVSAAFQATRAAPAP